MSSVVKEERSRRERDWLRRRHQTILRAERKYVMFTARWVGRLLSRSVHDMRLSWPLVIA